MCPCVSQRCMKLDPTSLRLKLESAAWGLSGVWCARTHCFHAYVDGGAGSNKPSKTACLKKWPWWFWSGLPTVSQVANQSLTLRNAWIIWVYLRWISSSCLATHAGSSHGIPFFPHASCHVAALYIWFGHLKQQWCELKYKSILELLCQGSVSLWATWSPRVFSFVAQHFLSGCTSCCWEKMYTAWRHATGTTRFCRTDSSAVVFCFVASQRQRAMMIGGWGSAFIFSSND